MTGGAPVVHCAKAGGEEEGPRNEAVAKDSCVSNDIKRHLQ